MKKAYAATEKTATMMTMPRLPRMSISLRSPGYEGRHKTHAQGADKGWQSIVLIQGSAAACYHGEYVSHQTQMNVYIQKSSYVFSEKMIIQLIRVFEFIFVT